MIRIGFSTRLDHQGKRQPYLVVVDDGKERLQSRIALPSDRKYLNPPVHPIHGNLLEGPSPVDVTNALRTVVSDRKIAIHRDVENLEILQGFNVAHIEDKEYADGEDAFEQIRIIGQQE